jgi:hypothetical protein
MSKLTARGHVHGEAFMLMKYRADDGTEEELIWNSRDGVTPFVITLKSGKTATHVEWTGDAYAPRFEPPIGTRIFVDLTRERAQERALRSARRHFSDTQMRDYVGPGTRYPTPEILADDLVREYFSHGTAPDLIEVTATE